MPSSSTTVNPLDKLVFSIAGSNAHSMVKGAALGVALQGLLLGMIYSHSFRYFSIFNESDPRLYRALVGCAVVINTAQMAMGIWQTMFLIEHDHDVASILHIDVACNMMVCLWIAITNALTTGYFYRRAWSLGGRKWWLLAPAIAAILASLGLGCVVVAYGLRMPRTQAFADLQPMLQWYHEIGRVAKAWAILSFSMDVLVCVSMFIFLAATENEFRKAQNRLLLRRMYLVTTETMLPPALVALGIFISFELHGVTLLSLDRALCWIMPNVFFLAVLHSLVARQRLATVIFAPNRGSAEDRDSTELRKVEDLVSKRESFVQLQNARSPSHDDARRSWLPVLAENAAGMQVNVEGVESLSEDLGDPSGSSKRNTKDISHQMLPPIASTIMPETTFSEQHRRQSLQPTLSPYGYPLADR
ncbi:hypothetical protein NliqN6_4589 [Naganishia liquefaciens]|uniref:Uncharacterized protein n=1 Tax=Naganishia liquefaciens TaxID=104408 RepID=A0A8H3TW29_9TREE|nr:hypothetical protein NliqN6_4589 [Naganishia liquefaciens]